MKKKNVRLRDHEERSMFVTLSEVSLVILMFSIALGLMFIE